MGLQVPFTPSYFCKFIFNKVYKKIKTLYVNRIYDKKIAAETYAVLYWKFVKVLCRLVKQQFNLGIVDFLAVDSIVI